MLLRRLSTLLVLFCLLLTSAVRSQPELAAAGCLDIGNVSDSILDILYIQADRLWHAGQYTKIVPIYRLITRLDPQDEEAWACGAWILISGIAPTKKGASRKQCEEKGIEILKEGIRSNPDTYRLYWELGWVYYSWQKYEDALSLFDKSIQYDHPFYVETTRAHTLAKLGRYKEAVRQWEQVKEKYPHMKDVAEKFISQFKDAQDAP
jgi:tetratricopeptide (TPR) repeat protein